MISIFFFILLDALQVFYSWIELVSQFGIYLPVEVGRLQTVFVMEAELLIISGASVGRPDDIQSIRIVIFADGCELHYVDALIRQDSEFLCQRILGQLCSHFQNDAPLIDDIQRSGIVSEIFITGHQTYRVLRDRKYTVGIGRTANLTIPIRIRDNDRTTGVIVVSCRLR